MYSFHLFFNICVLIFPRKKKEIYLIALHYLWNDNLAKQIIVMFSVIFPIIISNLSSIIHSCFLHNPFFFSVSPCSLPGFQVAQELLCIYKSHTIWYVWQGKSEWRKVDFAERKKQAKTKYGSANYMLEGKHRSPLLSGEEVGSWSVNGR